MLLIAFTSSTCCGDFFQDAYVTPFSVTKPVGQSVTLSAFELHSDCYGFTYPVEQSASWSSSNPAVATVSGGQVTLIGAGQTTITALWNSKTSVSSQCTQGGFLPGPIGSETCCSTALFFRSASATVAAAPKINSISPAFGAPATTVQVIISGAGFGADSVAVVGGNGISVIITNKTANQLTASFDIALNATAGDHNVTVTSNNQTSNSKTFSVRVPHHLVVVSDPPNLGVPNCAIGTPVARSITFRVVDSNGNSVGAVQVKENFVSVSFNTCRADGMGPEPSPCQTTDTSARFTDNISVNCNIVNGSCGYNITDQWQWCPSGGQAVTLATLTDVVHANQITVNGNANGFPSGTIIRP